MRIDIFGRAEIFVANNFAVKDRKLIWSASQINTSSAVSEELFTKYRGLSIAIYYPKEDMIAPGRWLGNRIEELDFTMGYVHGKTNLSLGERYVFVGDPKVFD